MSTRPRRNIVRKPIFDFGAVFAKPSLKRKRWKIDGPPKGKTPRHNGVVQNIDTDGDAPVPVSIQDEGSPRKDTTSETSALTSADELITGTSATGMDGEEHQQGSEARNSSGMPSPRFDASRASLLSNSVEGNTLADMIAANRKAMEILVEVANRERHRAYGHGLMTFGGPAAIRPPYAGPVHTYSTPFAHGLPTTYSTPFANPTTRKYVTPYADPPAPLEAGGRRPSNAVIGSESSAGGRQQRDAVESMGNDAAEPESEIDDQMAPETSNRNLVGMAKIRKDRDDDEDKDEDDISLSSPVDIDNFLMLANGGVPLGQHHEQDQSSLDDDIQAHDVTAIDAPPSPADTIDQALSRADEDIQALADDIATVLMRSDDHSSQAPPSNPYAVFYSTMSDKQLGTEFQRLVAIAEPRVNAIMSLEHIQAAHLFYTHLASHVHSRNAAILRPVPAHPMHIFPPAHYFGPGFFHPPPPPPKGFMVQWHDSITGAPLPSPIPLPSQPMVPSNSATMPPVANVDGFKQNAAKDDLSPRPGRRTGLRSAGGKRSRTSGEPLIHI